MTPTITWVRDLLATLDGGNAAAAIAAITAFPPGPRRALEVATWARRIAADPEGAVLYPITPETTEDEARALAELSAALEAFGWGAP